MSKLSEKLEELKNRRNLNINEIAKECYMDVSTVFRWINGEREPSNIILLQRLEKAMHLTVSEMDEVEAIYKNNLWGKQYREYQACVDVLRVIKDGEQYIQEKKERIRRVENYKCDERHWEKSQLDVNAVNPMEDLPVFEQMSREYQIYEAIQRIQNYIQKNKISNIRILSRLKDGEANWLLQSMYRNFNGVEIQEIISMDEITEKDTTIEKLNALKVYIRKVIQFSNADVYISEMIHAEDQLNWMLFGNAVFLFDNSLRMAVLATEQTFVSMYQNMYATIMKHSMKIDIERVNINKYFVDINTYGKIKEVKSFEYQPCIVSGLTRTIIDQALYPDIPHRDEIAEHIISVYCLVDKTDNDIIIKTFFTEAGMDDFCENGICNIFQYPLYRPFRNEEKKVIFDNVIAFSEEDVNIHYLVKSDELQDIKNIHIQYMDTEDMESVKIEFFITETETMRFIITDADMIGGFRSFFEYMEQNMDNYDKEETIAFLKRKVKEYLQ